MYHFLPPMIHRSVLPIPENKRIDIHHSTSMKGDIKTKGIPLKEDIEIWVGDLKDKDFKIRGMPLLDKDIQRKWFK